MRRYTITINGKDVAVDVRELAAERFQVHVGGSMYDVAVSEENVVLAAPLRAPAALIDEPPPPSQRSNAPRVAPMEQESSSAIPPGATPMISAPMPGVILSVDVTVGAPVTRGQSLVTLEAMKMRNSIRSPRDGVVQAIHVSAGESVAHGAPLVEVVAQ